MREHHWKVRTADGVQRYRATRFARQWRIACQSVGDDQWTDLAPPFSADLLTPLRDLLWAKYQRRRLAFETVREIDRLLPPEQRRTESP
jgi:hypothetical protein